MYKTILLIAENSTCEVHICSRLNYFTLFNKCIGYRIQYYIQHNIKSNQRLLVPTI
jgi:hypothetical protein